MQPSESVTREATSSIELQRAKDGTNYWTIKKYFDGSVAGEMDAAIRDIADANKKLRAEFLPDGSDG